MADCKHLDVEQPTDRRVLSIERVACPVCGKLLQGKLIVAEIANEVEADVEDDDLEEDDIDRFIDAMITENPKLKKEGE